MAKKSASRNQRSTEGKRNLKTDNLLWKPGKRHWVLDDFQIWLNKKRESISEVEINLKTTPQKDLKAIAEYNKELLKDSYKWSTVVGNFYQAIGQMPDEEREYIIKDYIINLNDIIFENKLLLSGITFPCAVSFNSSHLKEGVSFERAIFKEDVFFCKTNFGNETSFNNAVFEADVYFIDSVFTKSEFKRTAFEGDVYIKHTNFKKEVSFYKSVFEKDIVFQNKHLTEKFNAADMVVKGNAFIQADFKDANFERIRVEGSMNFLGCNFELVPNFRDCMFHHAPEVAGVKVRAPKMISASKVSRSKIYRYGCFKFAKKTNEAAKYRKLKAMALAANDHEKDGEFFSYEMMAKRGHETKGLFPLLLNSLYGLLSYYGQSIARPCWAMISSWFFFWLLAIGLTTPQMGTLKAFSFSALHSLFNIVPLIGGLFRSAAMPNGHETWYDKTYHELIHAGFNADYLTAFSTVQQFMGIIFFFLLVLGLRNKFRLK